MDYPPRGLPPQGGMVYVGHTPTYTHRTLRSECSQGPVPFGHPLKGVGLHL